MCVYSIVQRREKENDSRYTGGISPCSRTVYQTCNIMYICNIQFCRKDLPDGIQHVSKHQVEIVYLTQSTSSAKQCLAASAVLSIF